MFRSIIILALFLINFACTNSDDSQQYLVRLDTDKNSYAADTSTTIYLYVSNEGELPVYYLCKGVIMLYECENGNINKSWTVNGFEYCGVSTMSPNSSFTIDLTFLKWMDLPGAKFNDNVIYKFNFQLFKDNNAKEPLNDENQISNYFKILR